MSKPKVELVRIPEQMIDAIINFANHRPYGPCKGCGLYITHRQDCPRLMPTPERYLQKWGGR